MIVRVFKRAGYDEMPQKLQSLEKLLHSKERFLVLVTDLWSLTTGSWLFVPGSAKSQ